jgi:hypothetical protein
MYIMDKLIKTDPGVGKDIINHSTIMKTVDVVSSNTPIKKLFHNSEEFTVVIDKIMSMGPEHERKNFLVLLKSMSSILAIVDSVKPIKPIENGMELSVVVPGAFRKMTLPIKYPASLLDNMSEIEKRVISEGPMERVLANALIANCLYYVNQFIDNKQK